MTGIEQTSVSERSKAFQKRCDHRSTTLSVPLRGTVRWNARTGTLKKIESLERSKTVVDAQHPDSPITKTAVPDL